MVVVDTNILAYLLIEGDRNLDVQALFARDADWKSEAFVLIEFSNILATYLRADSLTRNQAHALLVEAEKRLTGLVSLPHARALRVAEQFGVSARFLGAAQSFKTRLVTEDAHACAKPQLP
jgi:predicted nucleic acid-binding protein